MFFLYHTERKKKGEARKGEGTHNAKYIIQYLLPVKKKKKILINYE